MCLKNVINYQKNLILLFFRFFEIPMLLNIIGNENKFTPYYQLSLGFKIIYIYLWQILLNLTFS